MNLSFQPQFVEPILNGTKIHTIREDKHNRWHVGSIIHFCTGLRTKDYNCFDKGFVVSVQTINIMYHWKQLGPKYIVPVVTVDHKIVNIGELARNDGFNSADDFLKWFDDDFSGKIIHWTEARY